MTEIDQQMQQKFANALGNPDKAKRDKHMRLLRNLISTQHYEELEMMKLWKALYYCLWLADKSAVQDDVSQRVCSLVHICKDEAQAQLFARCFFKTIMREWGSMDYHRVNKFYSCIRIMLREIVVYLKEREWAAGVVSPFLADIDAIVLNTAPNGPRMHMADIFLKEVYNGACKVRDVSSCLMNDKATKKKAKKANANANANAVDADVDGFTIDSNGIKTLPDSALHQLMGPWLKIACSERDHVFRNRVLQEVFSAFASSYCRELAPMRTEGEPATKKPRKSKTSGKACQLIVEEEPILFLNNDSQALQGLVWNAAAGAGLGKLQREGLYGVHELFQKVTGVQFVDEDYAGAAKMKKVAAVVAAAAEEKDSEEDDSKDWDSDADGGLEFESSEEEEEVKPEPLKPVVAKKDTPSKKRKLEAVTVEEKKKEKTPVKKKENDSASFIASQKFCGAKTGYVFKKDKQGVGYYLDAKGSSGRDKSPSNGGSKGTLSGTPTTKAGIASKSPKCVRFGSDQTVSHNKSVKALQASKSPEQARQFTPKKAALKNRKR